MKGRTYAGHCTPRLPRRRNVGNQFTGVIRFPTGWTLNIPVYAFKSDAQPDPDKYISKLAACLKPLNPQQVRADLGIQRTFTFGMELSRALGLTAVTGVPIQHGDIKRASECNVRQLNFNAPIEYVSSTDPVTSLLALHTQVPISVAHTVSQFFITNRPWPAALVSAIDELFCCLFGHSTAYFNLHPGLDSNSSDTGGLGPYASVADVVSMAPHRAADWRRFRDIGWPVRADIETDMGRDNCERRILGPAVSF